VLGLTFDKLLIIGVIAVFLIGPERLPHYAARLAQLVRGLRDLANGARERLRDEMGPEFDEVDWTKLDPRQYDPRRIIREALLEDEPGTKPVSATPRRAAGAAVAGAAAAGAAGAGAAGAGAAGAGAAGAGTAAVTAASAAAGGAGAVAPSRPRRTGGEPAPYDVEAT